MMAPTKIKYLTTIPDNLLTFVGPITKGRTIRLMLMNLTKDVISFKLKTTTPELFFVTTIWGYLEPGYQKEVLIGIKTSNWKKIFDKKSEHNFMLLAHPADKDKPYQTPEQFWEKARQKNRMQMKKLPVRFENKPAVVNSDKEVQADIINNDTLERVEFLQDWLYRLQDESSTLQQLLEDRIPEMSSSVVSLDSGQERNGTETQSEVANEQKDRSFDLEEFSVSEMCERKQTQTDELSVSETCERKQTQTENLLYSEMPERNQTQTDEMSMSEMFERKQTQTDEMSMSETCERKQTQTDEMSMSEMFERNQTQTDEMSMSEMFERKQTQTGELSVSEMFEGKQTQTEDKCHSAPACDEGLFRAHKVHVVSNESETELNSPVLQKNYSEVNVEVHEAPVEVVLTSYARRVHRVTQPL